MIKPTLVLGASINPERISFQAVHLLRKYGHPVMALGLKQGTVADVTISNQPEAFDPGYVHTVTLYLNPNLQVPYYEQILAWRPERVIFNPGTENLAFAQQLEAAGIEPVFACTLVMLGTRQY